ncbi:MAG: proline dehydrogenase family protein [Gemmatimonadota bacterium]
MGLARRTLLRASTNPWLSRHLPRYRFVRRTVRSFMPGERIEDAVAEAARLAERGVPSLLTLLGENVETPAGTRAVVEEYRQVVEEARRRGLDAQISVKLTHLGLDLDAGLARRNLTALADAAAPDVAWIDMESSGYVDRTLELFRALRRADRAVGVCLQAYLRRTPEDLESLLPLEPAIRLVKGAYAEPPKIAFPKKEEVDRAYLELAGQLLDHVSGRPGFAAFGTHDPRMIEGVRLRAQSAGVADGAWEIEMLYGIGRRLQDSLIEGRVPLRVLISYGEAWFPWYMRRLAERPANVWFVMRSLLR